jgi:hypothetical protein
MTPPFNFNDLLQQAKTASFDALPKGDYDAECVEATATMSSTGKPMIKTKWEVITGPYARRKFFNNFNLTLGNETALAIFFRNMKNLGLTESFFTSIGAAADPLGPVAAALVGRRGRFTLGIRPWQGEDRNQVEGIKPLVGAATAPMPGAASAAPMPGTPAPNQMPAAPPATPPPVAPAQQAAPAVAPGAPVASPMPQPVAPPVAAPVQPAVAAPVAPPPVVAPPAAPAPLPPAPAPQPAAVAQPAQPAPAPAPVAEAQPAAAPAAAPAIAPPPPMPF